MENNSDKFLEAQVEEIEVLCSIYGDEWKTYDEAERTYSIEIVQNDLSVTLFVTLSEKYPLEAPPVYTLCAPSLSKEFKNHLANQLDEVYLENLGQTVIFQWIEKIRECLSEFKVLPEPEIELLEEDVAVESIVDEVPTIIQGEVITDRKSVFQGHAALVHSTDQVRQVLKLLKENKKIANATHNIYAYRIAKTGSSSFIQDCDDDGESQAGGRLLHLLQILDVTDVLVVVTRWYGGIRLGSDRFRHINNSARQVLEKAGMITNSSNKKKKN